MLIRSTIFNFIFIGWTIFLLSTLWILLPLSRNLFRHGIALWPRGIFPLMENILNLKFEQRGLHNIPDGPVIYAAKHQSTWDTMYFLWLDRHNAYIMKEELNRIPFWKLYMSKSEHIVVNRRGGMAAMRKMIAAVGDILNEGRSVVIFPEGTRTEPGLTERYHPGIAALYEQVDATIIPVALNSGTFWGRRKFLKRPGRITINFLPPIPKGLNRKSFMTELKTQIELNTRKLEKEADTELSTET